MLTGGLSLICISESDITVTFQGEPWRFPEAYPGTCPPYPTTGGAQFVSLRGMNLFSLALSTLPARINFRLFSSAHCSPIISADSRLDSGKRGILGCADQGRRAGVRAVCEPALSEAEAEFGVSSTPGCSSGSCITRSLQTPP